MTEKQRIENSFFLSHCGSLTTLNSLYSLLMSILFCFRTNIEGGITQTVTVCGTCGSLIIHIHRFFSTYFPYILFRNSILIVWMVTFHLFLFRQLRVSYGRFAFFLQWHPAVVVNNFMWKYLSHFVDRKALHFQPKIMQVNFREMFVALGFSSRKYSCTLLNVFVRKNHSK